MGFVALLVTFGGVTIYTVVEVGALGEGVTKLHETVVPLPSAIAELKGDVRQLTAATGAPASTNLRRTVNQLRRVDRTLDRITADFTAIKARLINGRAGHSMPLQAEFARLDQQRQRTVVAVTRFFDDVETNAPSAESASRASASLAALGRRLDLFAIQVDYAISQGVQFLAEKEEKVTWGAVVLAAVAMVLGIIIALTARRVLNPLRTLRSSVERLALGDYAQRVSIAAGGELGALAAEVNRMAEAIQGRDAQLSAQQKQLLHRERLATVGKLSAQITHELRNPLSSIGLNSELLKEELSITEAPPDLEGARDLLSNIIREVERLREITEEYLRFARLPRPERVPVDLNHAAAELLEFVRSEMQQANVRIRLDEDRAALPAYVDPNQLRAALLNLLRNAREAMPDGGHVVLRVRSLGGQATLEVIDDGPGVPDDLKERLFEPFFSTKPQGTGLGLSMVRKIMETLEGEVAIESTAGKGTTVRLSMPLASEADS